MQTATHTLPPLLLVGCGRMGRALFDGWVAQGLQPSVVVNPSLVAVPAPHRHVAHLDAVPPDFRPHAIVVAVKPQRAEAVLPDLARWHDGAVVLSVMAGLTVARLRATSGVSAVVRAMPNTPAAIGAGMSVACPADDVTATQKALCDRLLGAVGRTAWVDDEAQMDAVTAVSGSGPAYVFLLAELLEQAGAAQGLPPALARLLARQTITGAGLLLQAREDDAAALRQAVTSPGGTTQRALDVLMAEAAWPDAVTRAVSAAAVRSRELAQ